MGVYISRHPYTPRRRNMYNIVCSISNKKTKIKGSKDLSQDNSSYISREAQEKINQELNAYKREADTYIMFLAQSRGIPFDKMREILIKEKKQIVLRAYK